MKILAVAEQRDGALRNVSFEVVTAAKQIATAMGGGDVEAAVLGPAAVQSAAGQLARYGAGRIHVAAHEAFALYSPDGFAATLAALIRSGGYDVIVFPASSMGKDLAPRVAARLEVPLVTDVTEVSVENGQLRMVRPILAGRVFATVSVDASPVVLSVRANVFRPVEQPAGENVVELPVQGSPAEWRVTVTERTAAETGRLDVAEATIIVSGGRGMKGPENWHLLEALRDALGPEAALGASRAVVDAGWRPHAEQVGQTGKTVSPRLYFAVGISGAMQHLAGMRSSGTIVAINKDPDAPIFKVADFGLVGDATEVLPALTEAIRAQRGA